MNLIGMNMGSGMNTDPTMAAVSNDVTRNHRMADIMRMQSLQPIQNVGASPLSHLSPLQVIAQMLQGHVANKYNEQANAQQTDMLRAMQAHTEHGLQQYMQDYQNDPRAAVMNAMASQSPVVRAMATQELKGLMTPKTLANHATDASVIASGGNAQGFAAKDNLKPIQPGSLLMDEQGQLRTPTAQPGANAEIVNINGNILHKTPTGLDQVLKAPNITNTTTVTNAAQKAGLTSYFTDAAKQVSELGSKANTNVNLLRTLDELKQMDAKGVYSNVTSPAATFMSNLAEAAGVPISETVKNKLANTESYNATANDLWQSIVAKYGGNRGVTEKEAEQIKKSLPLVTYSPEARNLITDVLGRAAKRQINDYHTANDAFAKAVQADDPTIFSNVIKEVYTPNVTNTKVPDDARINQQSTQPAGVMSAEDYLKQFGK